MRKQYEMRKACFACTTPYQVIGAVSIVRAEGLAADIFLFGVFPDYDKMACRLEGLDLFEHVYAVDCSRISFFGRGMSTAAVKAKAFCQVAFPERYVSAFLPETVAYESFYSTSRAHAKLLLQRVLQKRNPQMQVVIYDDGLGSYLEQSHVLRTSGARRRAEKLLGWELFDPASVRIRLYLPEIAVLPRELRDCPLSKMPRLDWTAPEEKEILKTIFGVGESIQYRERVILFDNVRGSSARAEMFRRVDDCYRQILEDAGEDNVLFKGHPRSVQAPELPMHRVEEQGVSMEVFYAGMEDLDARVLIAYNSTAAYTPKILFGREPWVISLHRIVGPPLQENAETLYRTFLPTYTDKEKFLAPNSMEELHRMLLHALGRS